MLPLQRGSGILEAERGLAVCAVSPVRQRYGCISFYFLPHKLELSESESWEVPLHHGLRPSSAS